MNVVHIESRKSMRRGSEYEILVDVECDSRRMEQLTRMLSREVAAINLAQYEEIGSVPHPPLSAAPSFGWLIYHMKSCALFSDSLMHAGCNFRTNGAGKVIWKSGALVYRGGSQ